MESGSSESSAQVQIRELWHDKESTELAKSFISRRTSLETQIGFDNDPSPS